MHQDPSLYRRLPWMSVQAAACQCSVCLSFLFTFRHRRVPHLSWPLRTGQVRQHTGRLWMRVLWRLWEWLHDDEKLHGWVRFATNQLLHMQTTCTVVYALLGELFQQSLEGIYMFFILSQPLVCQFHAILTDYCTYVITAKYKVSLKRRQHSPKVIQCSIMQKWDLLMSNCLVSAYIMRNSISCATTLMVPATDYKELQQLIKLKKEGLPFNLRPSHYRSPFLSLVPPRGPQAVDEVLSLHRQTQSSRQLMSCEISHFRAVVFTCVWEWGHREQLSSNWTLSGC